MDKQGKYCCFLCPSSDYTEKSLDSSCPECRNTYGFPLQFPPEKIGRYRVLNPLGRGFYAVTYLCEYGKLNRQCVLKVTSKSVYDYFGKNFEEECRIHQDVSQDTEHIVSIVDYFEENITFGSVTTPCYVAELEFVDGVPLDEYLSGTQKVSARSLAQIAIDLFRIWREFLNKLKYHNDLHANNIVIQRLREDARRAEALDETIRAVAIDLGSVSDASKSDLCELRFGDQHWLCRHLQCMIKKLREAEDDIDEIDDLDNRIAEALERVLYFLLPVANAGRIPSADQLIKIVRDNFSRGGSPWKEPLKLERFDDSYNAGALEPWFVPFLLVDPDSLWLKRISAAGPLIITGMRGCGKTMLLRGLDLHARAAVGDGEPIQNVLQRLRDDRYVGLFVSCMSLLTIPGRSHAPAALERLFLAYCLEALRAVRHLKELDRGSVVPRYFELIAEAIEMNMNYSLNPGVLHSDEDLERFVLRTSSQLTTDRCVLKTSPADAFGSLSMAIRKCSPIWSAARIFFLLDDVSTRYLQQEMIATLFSALLFQNPVCAFKLTTEAQTLEMVLYSPGLVERARVGRDYDVFDLGAEVYEKTKARARDRKLFIEQILEQRAQYYPNHPKSTPRHILGDCILEDIARVIAASGSNSPKRKAAYHGISALSAVCVGDIGDVISIYDLILKKATGHAYPIKAETQSECYQNFCSRRLYDLNRRDSDLKDFALTFAEAAHELLVKSHRENKKNMQKRLRQYASIYVRITAGDTSSQFERIRELIDAGVFVLHGGTPRTKTRDGDPIQQFKLTYRKLFGLSNFIGLAERDRFELSGEQLGKWLACPGSGRDILLRNSVISDGNNYEQDNYDDTQSFATKEIAASSTIQHYQQSLFNEPLQIIEDVFSNGGETDSTSIVPSSRLSIEQMKEDQLRDTRVELVILGLGFEERTLTSINRLLSLLAPERAILIEYTEPGKGSEIKNIISKRVKNLSIISYEKVLSKGLELPDASTFVDITGLAKPVLFSAIRSALRKNRIVGICNTSAQEYYPLHEDVAKVLAADKSQDHYRLLGSLSKVLTGEKGPYEIDRLVDSDADESRRKVLCTFASAKHERLLSLLDSRDYDRVEIVIPPEGTPRNEISRIAAEIAAWNFRSTGTSEIHSDDLFGVVDWLTNQYAKWYIDRGYNVEFGLTGSKIQAVACAAVSVECKVAQCWYVRPRQFDPKRFTKGSGESRYYIIRREDHK